MINDYEKKALSIISGKTAYDNVSYLIEPADRIGGSEAEWTGMKKVKERLEPYVDTCDFEAVPVTFYNRVKGVLEVVSPVRVSIPCTMGNMSSSGCGTVTLVDVGYGKKSNYENLNVNVENCAVLTKTEGGKSGPLIKSPLEERTLIISEAKYRKASCILFNLPDRNEALIPTMLFNVDLPVFIISAEANSVLKDLLAQNEEVVIRYEAEVEERASKTYNVVGTITGSEYPDEVIYVTGHYDSWFFGANDNISTIACVIETAKMFSKLRPKRTIKFIAFGSEESGYKVLTEMLPAICGSWGYSEAHFKELNGSGSQKAIGIINGEFMGVTERMDAMCSAELLPQVRKAVSDLGHYAVAKELPENRWICSDHFSFSTLGVPSVFFWQSNDTGTGLPSPFFGTYHTPADNINSIKPTALKKNALLMALMVLRIDSQDIPYSLEALRDTALKGLGYLLEDDLTRQLFDIKAKKYLEFESRDKKIKYLLDLCRIVNTHLYTVIGASYVNKFETIGDTILKLRDARNILEVENDLKRTKDVLCTIVHTDRYFDLSEQVKAEIDKLVLASKEASRMTPYILHLDEIFNAIEKQEDHSAILLLIQLKIDHALKMAEKWALDYRDALTLL